MSETSRNHSILVIGGTGLVGRPIVRHLDSAGWSVRTMSRHPGSAKLPPRVEVVVGDANVREELRGAVEGMDAVLICVSDLLDPYLDLRVTSTVVDLAKGAGVERVGLISGATVAEERRAFPMVDAKLQAEACLREGGVPFTIFRLTWPMESLARFVQKGRAMVLGRQPATIHPVAGDDVGRIVCRAFELGEAANRTLTIHGPEPTTIAAWLERYLALTEQDASVRHVPLFLLRGVARLTHDEYLAGAVELMAYFEEHGEHGDPSEANALLGAPTITTEAWVEARKAQPPAQTVTSLRSAGHEQVHGTVAPGFEEVREELDRSFRERGEVGAAVAAYHRGEKVVDLWGGHARPDDGELGDTTWSEDTMVVVMSCTKGVAAMTLALANARGWLDYEAPVARYWPEFAQAGKEAITVRQLLGHEAGLATLDTPLAIAAMDDLDGVAEVLARQAPSWPPGTRHGYHTMSIGLYMQELIRRVDPDHRTLGQVFAEEIARPLALDFHIGLPDSVPMERLAHVEVLSVGRALLGLRKSPPAMLKKALRPGSLLFRSYGIFEGLDWNDRATLEVELPASNGVGTARALAKLYGTFAEGGEALGITTRTFDAICAPPPADHPEDEVIGVPTYFNLGFLRPGPNVLFGSSPRAFGAPGAGGSFAFADPDAHLGFAYVMNKLDFYLSDDPREKSLRDAVYRAVRARS
jgi:CubicO group peptidase (beta-lactamase class C family)/uncharacterized protein YbjT (DUF2867 family)